MLIREAKETDIAKLLVLMKELARFERYIDVFAVTEDILLEQGFRRSPPDFCCFVAEDAEKLVGMVVYYFIPFTAIAKPTLFIKELLVAAEGRGRGTGKLLMKAVAEVALRKGCGAIKWQVAPWNKDGIRFYEQLGAKANRDWIDFGLSAEAMRELAGS
jgi:GNAT superfamily N-acetyltransferase